MPQNAYTDDLPVELQLDLLVDGELAEARRRDLLVSLDERPAGWRALALRFLQQQTEKQSVRALMAGGKLVPVENPQAHRPIIGRIGWYRLTAVAAGLFIAAGTALVTLVVVKPLGVAPTPSLAAEFHTALPADVIASPSAVPVSVPVVPIGDNAMLLPTARPDNNGRASKDTILIQYDGKGGYMVIPVSTSKTPVY